MLPCHKRELSGGGELAKSMIDLVGKKSTKVVLDFCFQKRVEK